MALSRRDSLRGMYRGRGRKKKNERKRRNESNAPAPLKQTQKTKQTKTKQNIVPYKALTHTHTHTHSKERERDRERGEREREKPRKNKRQSSRLQHTLLSDADRSCRIIHNKANYTFSDTSHYIDSIPLAQFTVQKLRRSQPCSRTLHGRTTSP